LLVRFTVISLLLLLSPLSSLFSRSSLSPFSTRYSISYRPFAFPALFSTAIVIGLPFVALEIPTGWAVLVIVVALAACRIVLVIAGRLVAL